jgi:hypothetical protein
MITAADWQRWGVLFAIGLAVGLAPSVIMLLGAVRDHIVQVIWEYKWAREQRHLYRESTLGTLSQWKEQHGDPYSRLP